MVGVESEVWHPMAGSGDQDMASWGRGDRARCEIWIWRGVGDGCGGWVGCTGMGWGIHDVLRSTQKSGTIV